MRKLAILLLFVSLGTFGQFLRPANVAMHWSPNPPPDTGTGIGAPDHWWKFTESAGTTVEDHGDATDIDGTLAGSNVGSSHTWEPAEDMGSIWTGALEQIANLTSADSSSARRVELASNPDFNSASKFTLCMWLNKYSAGSQPTDQRLFSQADSWGEDDHVVMFGFTSGDTFRARLRTASGDTSTYVFNESATDDTDIHACLVLDLTLNGNELVLYIDGTSAETENVSGTQIYDDVNGTIYTFLLAQKAANNYSSPFNGLIADMRLWIGTAATADDVDDIYNDALD